MIIITDNKRINDIWDKLYNEYYFFPSTEISEKSWINLPNISKKYQLNSYWTEYQEKIINEIFEMIIDSDMYALDWQHDCFIFNPQENIPYGFSYFDEKRDVNVFYPTYYPDGDYHFFISIDWHYGLFGHPWRKEIYVMGKELIEQFDLRMEELSLSINN